MTVTEFSDNMYKTQDEKRALAMLVLVCLSAVLAVASLRFGVRGVSWGDVVAALMAYDGQNPDHLVIMSMRLPRAFAAVLVGASLGAAGALMQGMTRNPLADPGLLGVNAGAGFAVVICIWVLGITHSGGFVWAALIGAFLASALTWFLGGRGKADVNPVRLLLAGAAVSALFLSLVRCIMLISQQTLEVYRFWVLGGLDGITMEQVLPLLPFFAAGAGGAAFSAMMMNALVLGQDTARALGLRLGLAQGLTALAIVLLCAASVSLAGPIAFIGLMVPHLARSFAGADMRWRVLLSAFCGAVLLQAADIAGRLIFAGTEIQAGVMVAMIGGPVLIYLVRRGKELSL